MEASFRYSESNRLVYCEYCGALAGEPSQCLVYKSHKFVATSVMVVCQYCGAVPGTPTTCAVYRSHGFTPPAEPQ